MRKTVILSAEFARRIPLGLLFSIGRDSSPARAGGPSFRDVAKGWALVLSVGSQRAHPCEGRKDAAPRLQNHSEARTASLRTKNGRIVSYAWDAAGSEQGS